MSYQTCSQPSDALLSPVRSLCASRGAGRRVAAPLGACDGCGTGAVWGVLGHTGPSHQGLVPSPGDTGLPVIDQLCSSGEALVTAPAAGTGWAFTAPSRPRGAPTLPGQESWRALLGMEGQIPRAGERFCLTECDLDQLFLAGSSGSWRTRVSSRRCRIPRYIRRQNKSRCFQLHLIHLNYRRSQKNHSYTKNIFFRS